MKAWIPLVALLACACAPPPVAKKVPVSQTPAPKPSDFLEGIELSGRPLPAIGAAFVPQSQQLVVSLRGSGLLAILTLGDEISLKQLSHYPIDYCMYPAVSPDGKYMAIDECGASGPSQTLVYRTDEWTLLHTLEGGTDFMPPRWDGDSRTLYTAGPRGAFRWNAKTGRQEFKYQPKALFEEWGWTDFADLSNPAIVDVRIDGKPTIFIDLNTGRQAKPKTRIEKPLHRFTPDRTRRIDRSSERNSYFVTDLATGKEVNRWMTSKGDLPQDFGFLTDDLAYAGDNTLQILSMASGKAVAALAFFRSESQEGQPEHLMGWAAILPDGRFTGSAGVEVLLDMAGKRRDDEGVAEGLTMTFAEAETAPVRQKKQ